MVLHFATDETAVTVRTRDGPRIVEGSLETSLQALPPSAPSIPLVIIRDIDVVNAASGRAVNHTARRYSRHQHGRHFDHREAGSRFAAFDGAPVRMPGVHWRKNVVDDEARPRNRGRSSFKTHADIGQLRRRPVS